MKNYHKQPKFKSHDKCRFCPHIAYDHMTVVGFGENNMRAKWDQCSRISFDRSLPILSCTCPGFGPVDNLLYLEMAYDESSSL